MNSILLSLECSVMREMINIVLFDKQGTKNKTKQSITD